MFHNNKCNKRVRSKSPNNYEEEYISSILDESSNICEKENEKNTAEVEQVNEVFSKFYFLIIYYSFKFL